ncbi:DUF916 and DUF3324 domain-containing protein [Enterococcus larvae]|uniref:DUF916 and DUF3324 domain-containing protein n=1 Tax=Enterococcus larvae TaxID=2794352 RepID=UPI003F372C64
MKKRFGITLLTTLLFFAAAFTGNSKAWGTADSEEAEETSAVSASGFTYNIIYPENQTDSSLGYYRLGMTPGQQQTISFVLNNSSSEAITIDLALNGAKTNKNGVIEYANSEIENDASLVFAFEDLVTGPESVDLAAGETKQVDLSIQMPETSFEGVVAGGIQLMRAGQAEDADTSGGSTVINQYAYVISILLQESETELTPDLKFNSAYAGQLNYRNSVYANVSNVVAAYLNDLTVEAQVMKQGSSTVLYEAKKTSMRMAPNSFMEFPITMNGDQMEAGTYTLRMIATSGELSWDWTEEFEISDEEAQKYNERDVGLTQETGIDWTLVAMIVGGFVGLVVVIFLVVTLLRRKKGKQKGGKSKKKGNESRKKKV